MTDEEFETLRQAVLTIISEKDINLSRENDRFMGEITSHKYNFASQSQNIETLASITKADF
jgi:secreted Zn-dependent insulinase-like peptidase